MIQRIQSIYLLIVSIIAGSSLFVPFEANRNSTILDSISNYPVMKWLVICIAVMSIVNIFLFFNRQLQLRISYILGGLIFIFTLMLYNFYNNAANDQIIFYTSFFGFPIAEFIFLSLACIGIIKDNNLVKSADRLR